ncbi:MAG TPA: porphobilinogen synthase [bacterium]|nr:porphobilinogen synthase [bacterium]
MAISSTDFVQAYGFAGPHRSRRLRETPLMRKLVADVRLHRDMLVLPHFVVEDPAEAGPINAMPGLERMTVDGLVRAVAADVQLGVRSVLLFGLPASKDETGDVAADPNGIVPQAVRALKTEFGQELLVATDVCQCAYLSHGHCGFPDASGHIHNDASVAAIARIALVHAEAGVDLVAPSDMMDFRIAAIRRVLDGAGLEAVPIMSYAVKFASNYYGPFREAAGSAPHHGDRRSYQLDYRNAGIALREAIQDEIEGADILMVKPALAYLDIIRGVKERTDLPVAAYNVSGEYALVKLAAQAGLADEVALAEEHLLAMVRAGASVLITYHARELLRAGAV